MEKETVSSPSHCDEVEFKEGLQMTLLSIYTLTRSTAFWYVASIYAYDSFITRLTISNLSINKPIDKQYLCDEPVKRMV
jgi:hypothetical protein